MALKRFILLSALVFAACSDNVASGASEDVGITPLGKWQVAGLSQKGPFVTGSTVNVFELEGSTLNQTGKIFKSTIRSDKGDFVVSGPGLASQYAIIDWARVFGLSCLECDYGPQPSRKCRREFADSFGI